MRTPRRQEPVNAGSMADIAFLLLIFFLVTTTIQDDEGINRRLPRDCENPPCTVDLNERNVFRILINKQNQLFAEDKVIELSELRSLAVSFIDNNGDGTCTYCSGKKLADSSDNPQEAIISLTADREASYRYFVAVQNELSAAFTELRNNYALREFGKSIGELTDSEIKKLEKAYPQVISEADTK
ncbi:biopolymer transporter ExbD [Leptobacterium flavescens]|uniref:Biopolymer transporter ExbD n=1 Tax=Leptobacterium flavescens TaxID=472055 RepID=A0A6P0URE4_9FLAO|nr:biopolymer transporter ExbD [Leptobacterium flavescens]NER13433.1 biopolymer transporter ExbD [Leptobacterium flavescens]